MSEEETETIPYVIMVISLDNTYNLFGSSEKRNLTVNIADQIVELICNRIYKNNENNFKDIEELRNKFYIERYTNKFMWAVMSFINNEWKNTSPTDDLVLQILIKENERRCTDYISSCSEEESNLDELDILDELEELNKLDDLDDLDDLDVLDELYELDKLDDEGNIKKKVKM